MDLKRKELIPYIKEAILAQSSKTQVIDPFLLILIIIFSVLFGHDYNNKI